MLRFSVILSIAVFLVLALLGSASAQNWAAPLNVSNSPNHWSLGQSFTVDTRGKTHIVYVDSSEAGGYDDKKIYYRTNDTPDGQFSAPAQVGIPGWWLYVSQLALTHTSDDTLHLIVTAKICCWQSSEVVIYLSKPRGGLWSAPQALTATDGSQFAYICAIAALPDDSVYVLYLDNWRLASRTKPFGGSWGAEVTEFQAPEQRHFPTGWARAIGSDLYLTYDIGFETYGGCYYKVRRGGVWSGWTRISDFNCQTASRLTIAKSPATGELAAVYGYDTGDGANYGEGNLNFDIYARFSSDNGQTWTPQVRVSPGNSLDRGASCIYDSAGNLHVVWYGQVQIGDYGSILYRKRTADGIWGPLVNVSNNTGRSSLTFEPIQLTGNLLHLVYANSGNPPSGPGYEEVWYTTMVSPADLIPPGPVTNFTASAGEERAYLTWRSPSDPDLQSVVIRSSTTGYPPTPASGSLVTEKFTTPNANDGFLAIPLNPNVTYYFSAFAKDLSGNFSPAAQALATPFPDVTPPGNPISFTAVADSANNVTLSWTNASDPDLKGTMVRMSTTGYPSGPGSGTLVVNQTGAPNAPQSFVLSNLDRDVTYYFAAFAYDAKPNYSSGSRAQVRTTSPTIGAARRLPDGSPVVLYGKIVTALEQTNFYVEESDRSAGIRIAAADTGLAVGDRVNILGTVGTYKPDGVNAAERQVTGATVTRISGGAGLAPVALNCRAVGGAAVPPYIPGVKDGRGLNNIGLLVRISGRVTLKVTSFIYVDDGSNVQDVSGRVGVMVRCPSTSIPVSVGNIVAVTGIVEGSIPTGWTENRRYIRIRDWNDLSVVHPPPSTGAISGYVRDSGGSALSGATVATSGGGYSTTSGGDGSYTLSNVTPGTYSVTASKTNYSPQTVPGVTVAAGQTTTVNFSLSPQFGSIAGYVRDASSNPISGATVSTNTGGYSTTSGGDGSYTLSNVSPATYNVTASKTGYNSQTVSNVTVNANQTTTVNFNLTAIPTEKVVNGDCESGFFNTGWATTCSGLTSQLPGPNAQTWGWNNDASYPFNTFDSTGVKRGGSHALGFAFCQTASSPGKLGIAFQSVNLGGPGATATFSVWGYHTDGNCPSIMCWNPGIGQSNPYAAQAAGRYQWICTDNWGQRNTWLNRTMTVTADSSGYVTIMVGGAAHPGTASGARLYIDDVSVM